MPPATAATAATATTAAALVQPADRSHAASDCLSRQVGLALAQAQAGALGSAQSVAAIPAANLLEQLLRGSLPEAEPAVRQLGVGTLTRVCAVLAVLQHLAPRLSAVGAV
ncbi:MAG: hypothetical protein ACK4NM_18900, partial [Hydrogenophaga sp.]